MQRSIIEEDVHQASLANFTNSSFPRFFCFCFFFLRESRRFGLHVPQLAKKSTCVNDHLCMRIILCNTHAKGQQGIIGVSLSSP